MESEPRRKRKRQLKPTQSRFFSVRSLILCFFSFAIFLFLFSDRLRIGPAAFRPVLIASSLSLLSSSASNSIRQFSYGRALGLRVEDRVLFPDHVLMLVSTRKKLRNEFLYCVYYNVLDNSDENDRTRKIGKVVYQSALSVNVYGEYRSIVRCPLPPLNYSAAVSLRRRRGLENYGLNGDLLMQMNQTVHSWETVAYAAELDGDTAVVFVKGLNPRPGKDHDPAQFLCQYGSGNRERNGRFVLRTKAITAAQEVVRCSLPISIRTSPEKAEGIKVSIAVASRNSRGKILGYQSLPSVAKIFNAAQNERKHQGKHELCVCTMLWNQAAFLREWIMYHAWLGVERWFIYDNNSDDNIMEVIEELELENYNVSRHTWPWIKTQEAGFSHCALRAKNECKWVGFMDVDEFFYFPYLTSQHHTSIGLGFPGRNSLRVLVSNFSSSATIGEIRTACHSFGPSGLSSPPSQGVMTGYTCRLQSPERHKSIVRPDVLDDSLLNVVHHFRLRRGFRYLNLPQSTAVVNHYKYQVWETFRAKFFRRVATYVADWRENQNEGSRDRAPGLGTEAIEPPNWRLQFCEVWDTGLRDFVLANLADVGSGLLPWQRTIQ